jgi:hypothetical protein
MLQSYGYLLPTLNPSSEAGREDEDLRKESIRQRAAAELKAQPDSTGIRGPAQASCDPIDAPIDPNCEKRPSTAAEDESDVNPPALPRNRDSDQLLNNRGADMGGTNLSLSRTGANDPNRGDATSSVSMNSGQSENGTEEESGRFPIFVMPRSNSPATRTYALGWEGTLAHCWNKLFRPGQLRSRSSIISPRYLSLYRSLRCCPSDAGNKRGGEFDSISAVV